MSEHCREAGTLLEEQFEVVNFSGMLINCTDGKL